MTTLKRLIRSGLILSLALGCAPAAFARHHHGGRGFSSFAYGPSYYAPGYAVGPGAYYGQSDYYGGGYYGNGYGNGYYGNGYYDQGYYDQGYGYRRDHTVRNVALGVGAALLLNRALR